MAFLYSQGELKAGEEYRCQGILGTEFIGRIITETRIGNTVGIIPEVTGSAHVMALGSLVLTKDDPFPAGFDLENIDPKH